jgi:hypothetical protein
MKDKERHHLFKGRDRPFLMNRLEKVAEDGLIMCNGN